MAYEPTKPRAPIMAMFGSPGPCYALPGLVGTSREPDNTDERQNKAKHYKSLNHRHDPRSVHIKGPAYSFGIKHGQYRDDCSPGPSIYGPTFSPKIRKVYTTGPDGTPKFSMSFRPQSVHLPKMPGPADYHKERYGDCVYPRSPAYRMGERNKSRLTDTTPAPNAYEADSMLGKTVRSGKLRAPTYIIEGRAKTADLLKLKEPGPSDYKVVPTASYKTRAPVYTIAGRYYMNNGSDTHKASPAKYFHEKLNTTKTQAPRFSFGLRHSQYEVPFIVDVAD